MRASERERESESERDCDTEACGLGGVCIRLFVGDCSVQGQGTWSPMTVLRGNEARPPSTVEVCDGGGGSGRCIA